MPLPLLTTMSFTRSTHQFVEGFDSWLESDAGRALLNAERALLSQWLPKHVGQRAVEISCGRNRCLLKETPLPWYCAVGQPGYSGNHVQSRPDLLPLAKNSIDVLLLHHALEFSEHPHQLLREAGRCLAPGGMIGVIGFNPVSLMGLVRWLIWSSQPVWRGKYYRPYRINDWLQVLGFEVEGMASGFYTMPLGSGGRRRLRPVEWLSSRLWPRHGGVYLLVARKRAGLVRPLPEREKKMAGPTVIPIPMARWRHPEHKGS